MMKYLSLLLIALLFLSGCASTPKQQQFWTHPSMTQAEVDKEAYDCEWRAKTFKSTQTANVHDNVDAQWYVLGAIIDAASHKKSEYAQCMESKGFVLGSVPPTSKTASQNDSSAEYIVSAFQMCSKGDNAGALTLLDKSLKENPSYAEVYVTRGMVYGSQQRSKEALSDFNEALKLDPNNPMALMMRGAFYGEEKKYDLAIADFTKALNLNAKYFEAAMSRGFSHIVKKEFDFKMFEARGDAYTEIKDYDNAIADYTRAMDGNTDAKSLETNYDNRARANFKHGIEALREKNTQLAIGHYGLALKDIEEVLKLSPNSTDALSFRQGIYSARAQVYFARKEYDKAWADVHSAMSLGYGFDSSSDKTFLSDLKKTSGRPE